MHTTGLVVFVLTPNATAPTILGLVEALLKQTSLVDDLPGKLAIAEPGRVRLRSM